MAQQELIDALKIAFTFMPHPVEINRFEYGEEADRVLAQVNMVREVLLGHGVDPEEVAGEVNPDSSPNSCY